MISQAIVLRFPIRGPDGVKEHALVAWMRRRRGPGRNGAAWGDYPMWKLMRLELRRTRKDGTVQARVIPKRKVSRGYRDELSVQAERKARFKAGLRTRGDCP